MPVVLPTAKDIHGLKRLSDRSKKRLPFGLDRNQTVWSCMCGASWFSFGESEPTEAYRQHLEG